MSSTEPTSARIFASFAAGSSTAADRIFGRYVHRLCRLAQSRLTPRLRHRVDPEDIVMSAYRSFFVSARADRFAIRESGELWSLLTKITLRKLYRNVAFHTADKRSINAESDALDDADGNNWFASREPTPDEAVALSDELEDVLRSLTPQNRRIVELRLQGELFEDIASELGVSERTVRRAMAEITEGLRRRHGIDESVVPAETVALGRSQSGLNAPRIAKRRGAQDQLFQQLIDAGNSIQFERIILEQMIGQGGMGKVFEARCRDSGQKLAVKFLHKAFQFDERAVRRFSCEAQAVMKLNHPGIVKIRGIGQTAGGVYFIAMDLIEGDDLKHTVRSSCMRQSIGWVIDIAAALQHAHEAGIVHCDLKPSNVRVTSGNRPVLMDFGLARLLDGQQSSQHAIAGTAPWMAPEQIDAAFGQIGPRTDVYGLAALLYTLLCGQPPFSGNRTPDVLSQVISAARPVPPSQFQSDLPPVINDICMQALSKQPADRPQSMQLMIAALTDGLTEIGDG